MNMPIMSWIASCKGISKTMNFQMYHDLNRKFKIIKIKSQCLLNYIYHQITKALQINNNINHYWEILKMAENMPRWCVLTLRTSIGYQPWMASSHLHILEPIITINSNESWHWGKKTNKSFLNKTIINYNKSQWCE
jgi:hypothetical protein